MKLHYSILPSLQTIKQQTTVNYCHICTPLNISLLFYTVGVSYRTIHYSTVLSSSYPGLRFHSRLAHHESEPWTQDTSSIITFHHFTVQLFIALRHSISLSLTLQFYFSPFTVERFVASRHISLATMRHYSDTKVELFTTSQCSTFNAINQLTL